MNEVFAFGREQVNITFVIIIIGLFKKVIILVCYGARFFIADILF